MGTLFRVAKYQKTNIATDFTNNYGLMDAFAVKMLEEIKSYIIQFYFSQSRVMSKILSYIILFLIFVIREKMTKNSSRRGYSILLSRNWRGFCGGTFAFYYMSGKRFPIKFFCCQKFSSCLRVIKKEINIRYENLPNPPPQKKKNFF